MSFERAFEIVIGAEGGYSNDPADPGGETKFGISKRAYPNIEIKDITLQQAHDIYFKDYWITAGCGFIADEVMAILVFDCAVNQGVSEARKLTGTAHSPSEYQAERALHYASLPTFSRFGRGWMRRLFNVLLEAKA